MTFIGDCLEWFWTLSPTAAELCGPEDRKEHIVHRVTLRKYREIVVRGGGDTSRRWVTLEHKIPGSTG